MVDEKESQGANKTIKEIINENLIVIVVLIFSFIYFLVILYSWFASP